MKKIVKKILDLVFRIVPVQNIILFESSPDYADNTYAFFQYLLQQKVNQQYRMVWVLNGNEYPTTPKTENVFFVCRYSDRIMEKIRTRYYYNAAKYIFDSNTYVHPINDKQIRVYLGHGMPIKIVPRYCNRIGRANHILVTSKFFCQVYARIFDIEENRILTMGFPRNDVLVSPAISKKRREHYFGDVKLILWMPTYRQHRNNDKDNTMEKVLPLGIPAIHSEEEFRTIVSVLEKRNCRILFRPHPAQDLSALHINNTDSFILADDTYLKKNDMNLYQLLSSVDSLITDYSSVYYDFLLTGNPIGLTVEDMNTYFKTFEMPFSDFQRYIKGRYIYSAKDLINFIEDIVNEYDPEREERLAAQRIYHEVINGTSSERLYNFLIDQYGF